MVMIGNSGVKGAGSFTGQGFRVEFEIDKVGPVEEMAKLGAVVRDASVEAVVKTTETLKNRVRDYVDAHFTGSALVKNNRRRVSNAVAQSRYYNELDAKGQYAGLVYSKFGKREGGNFVDFLLTHVRGGSISPRRGDWLLIVNKNLGGTNAAGRKTGPGLAGSFVRWVPSRDGTKVYLLRSYGKSRTGSGRATQLLATLVRTVAMPARLTGIDELARQREGLFQGYFATAFDQRDNA